MAFADPREAGLGLPPIPSHAELLQAGIKVAVGIPLERNIPEAAFVYLWEVARWGWPLVNLWRHPHVGYGRTDVNREELARAFLRSDYTHLMMFDTDHLHPADAVNRLARWFVPGAVSTTPDVLYGMHHRRGEPYEPMMFKHDPELGLFGVVVSEDEQPMGAIEVDAAAHGTMLIARHVLEQLPEPWWAYDYTHADRETWPSEDVYFCRKVREGGFVQAVDMSQSSPHMTVGLIDWDEFTRYRDDHPGTVLPYDEQIAAARAKHEKVTA